MKDKLQYLKQKNGFSANRVLTVCLSGLLAKKLTALLLACLLCVCAFGCSAAPEDEPAHSPSLQDPELNKTDDTDNDVNLTGPGNDVSHGGTASGSDPSQNAGNDASTGTGSSSNSESSGHDSVQNPNQNENPGNNVVPDTPTQPDVTEESCTYCGKTGHKISSCPKNAEDEAPCSYCNQTGHKISSCPKKEEDETPCTYCGKTGHKAASCPTKAADEAPCTYCNKTGHKEANCPKKAEDETFDINYWVQYAKDYAVSIGMVLDEGVSSSWDNPLAAFAGHKFLEKNIKDRIDYYKTAGTYYYGDNVTCYLWVWAEEDESGKYSLYMGYGYDSVTCAYCNETGHNEANCPRRQNKLPEN